MRFFALKTGLVSAAIALLFTAGCGSMGSSNLESLDNFQQQLLGDMKLPDGVKIDNSQSLVLGGGTTWTGRIVISIPQGATDAFTFFRDQFSASGWTGISSIKAKTSILVFTKQDRTVTVEISESGAMSKGTLVTVTAAPKSLINPTSQGGSSAVR